MLNVVLTDIHVMTTIAQPDANTEIETGDEHSDAPICMDGRPAIPLPNCYSQGAPIIIPLCLTHLSMGAADLANSAAVFICFDENHVCCIIMPSDNLPLPPVQPV